MISLLRSLLAAVEGRPYTLPADVDDQQVLTVARRHRLTPLLSLRAAPATMPSLAEAFRRDRLITTARNAVLAQVALECASAFSGAGIETVLLKGLAYNATLYDAPGLRPTSEIFAPASASAQAALRAAPPLPTISTLALAILSSRESGPVTPAASVFVPRHLPALRHTVFTAPMRLASGSTASK